MHFQSHSKWKSKKLASQLKPVISVPQDQEDRDNDLDDSVYQLRYSTRQNCTDEPQSLVTSTLNPDENIFQPQGVDTREEADLEESLESEDEREVNSLEPTEDTHELAGSQESNLRESISGTETEDQDDLEYNMASTDRTYPIQNRRPAKVFTYNTLGQPTLTSRGPVVNSMNIPSDHYPMQHGYVGPVQFMLMPPMLTYGPSPIVEHC
nr:PREDICTED: uncharacterized protein LOC106705681 [Latimeria chalumnae]|eukprot:XP_014351026.1 PREDICTED: uncharacterized protein LOC106705681 [Latimeria chalumnae]